MKEAKIISIAIAIAILLIVIGVLCPALLIILFFSGYLYNDIVTLFDKNESELRIS